jgi:hypothetical protein
MDELYRWTQLAVAFKSSAQIGDKTYRQHTIVSTGVREVGGDGWAEAAREWTGT